MSEKKKKGSGEDSIGSKGGKNLSKNLLGMKFMKRKNEEDLRKRLEKDKKELEEKSMWKVGSGNGSASSRVVKEDGYGDCEEFIQVGRRSFKNFNPKVDELNDGLEQEKKRKRAKEEQKKINMSDEQFVAESANVYKRKKKRR